MTFPNITVYQVHIYEVKLQLWPPVRLHFTAIKVSFPTICWNIYSNLYILNIHLCVCTAILKCIESTYQHGGPLYDCWCLIFSQSWRPSNTTAESVTRIYGNLLVARHRKHNDSSLTVKLMPHLYNTPQHDLNNKAMLTSASYSKLQIIKYMKII